MKQVMMIWISCLLAFATTAQTSIVVAQDGSGNFKTIQEAINSLPADARSERVIQMRKGTYKEKLFIDKNFITLYGEDPKNTIITIALARDEWRCANRDDYGTATINLKGSDITLQNLSFSNTYGKDVTENKEIDCPNDSSKRKSIRPVGHQMALRSFATTRLKVINCIFTAYGGDTVSPWNTENGMFYFKDCTMEGGVDFYCPRGWAYAENCTFICHNKEAAIWHDGSANPSSKTVLVNCNFVGDDGFKLGRYHRDAQFYLVNCRFAKNMADADIYQRENNPPTPVKWGKRVYYYDCHRTGGDYAWHSNNLPAGTGINDISSAWAYDYKWKPVPDKRVTELQEEAVAVTANTDSIAENMLLYQRANGGWPKHFQGDKVDYKHTLTPEELKKLQSDYQSGIDATIDNEATSKEIKYLVKAFKRTQNKAYLQAAERGIDYLLKAQYANGGWPQFYPDFSSYRSQVTYNDNAMVNVLNIMQDIVERKNDFHQVNPDYIPKAKEAVKRGIECILATQLKQKGQLTAWCAQYNAKTLQPEQARKFELVSLSGSESVGIVRFLMRVDNPSEAIINAVKSAVKWFDKVKITGYNFVDVVAPSEPNGKDRVLKPDPGSVIWARFYDVDTNEPFFTGRDSIRKKTVAEIENERRTGYAWYGNWPAKLLEKEYPEWITRHHISQ